MDGVYKLILFHGNLWTNEAIVVIELLVSVGIAASSKREAQEVA